MGWVRDSARREPFVVLCRVGTAGSVKNHEERGSDHIGSSLDEMSEVGHASFQYSGLSKTVKSVER